MGVQLHRVECGACGNAWWVQPPQEFTPKFCCYCGTRFDCYRLDADGVVRNLAGQPLPPDEQDLGQQPKEHE